MMVRCKNGHYYDNAKNSECPYCCRTDLLSAINGNRCDERTIAMNSCCEESKTIALDSLDDAKTVSFYESDIQADPVVGWLVCISGSSFGHDFRLHQGRNSIGRSLTNDVVVRSDEKVSRDNHAALVYDYRANKFYLVPENSIDIQLNGTVITNPVEIKDNDRIALGSTKLVFVPFCRESFKWNKDAESHNRECNM